MAKAVNDLIDEILSRKEHAGFRKDRDLGLIKKE